MANMMDEFEALLNESFEMAIPAKLPKSKLATR